MENNQLQTNQSFLDKMLGKMETLEKATEIGQFIISAGYAPKHFEGKPQAIILAIDAGKKLGLDWYQALWESFSANGIPGYKAMCLKGLVLSSGLSEKWEDHFEGSIAEGTRKHVIVFRRKGDAKDSVREFTMNDAKLAGLWGKKRKWDRNKNAWVEYEDLWCKYPDIMLEARNTGNVCNKKYPDVCKGFKSIEELMDYPEEQEVVVVEGMTISASDQNTKLEESASKSIKNPVAETIRKEQKKIEAITPEVVKEEVKDMREAFLNDHTPAQEEQSEEIPIEALSSTKIRELCKTDKEKVLGWVDGKLGFDHMDIFRAANANRNVERIIGLIIAIRENMVDKWAEKELELKQVPYPKSIQIQEEPEPPSEVYYQIPPPDRDLNACMDLSTHLKACGINSVIIKDYLTEIGFEGTVQRYVAEATIEEIKKLIAAKRVVEQPS